MCWEDDLLERMDLIRDWKDNRTQYDPSNVEPLRWLQKLWEIEMSQWDMVAQLEWPDSYNKSTPNVE